MKSNPELDAFIAQYSAPTPTKTLEEVRALIDANIGTINEVRVMNYMFEMTAIRILQVRSRKGNSKTNGLPPQMFEYVKGICEDAANAIIKQDVGYFVRKYQYKQYVKARLTKNDPEFWMGPFHTPALTLSGSGKVKAYTALENALRVSDHVFKTK